MMSDPKNAADNNKVNFRAVQRWAGAGITTKMTMARKFKQRVSKCLMKLTEVVTLVLLCYFPCLFLPGSELNTVGHRLF